jgi:hypothetical protein
MWREDDFYDAVISCIMFTGGLVLAIINPCGFNTTARYVLVGVFSLLSIVATIQLIKEFFVNK